MSAAFRNMSAAFEIAASYSGKQQTYSNMVTDAILIHVRICLLLSGIGRRYFKRLEYGTAVTFTAAQIKYGATLRCVTESVYETSYVFRMNIISHLLTFIAEYFVFTLFDIALDKVTQEAM